MWKTRRFLLTSLLLISVSVLSAFGLAALQFMRVVDLKLSDFQFALRGIRPTPKDIVLVTIDDATLAAFPEAQLFWHRYYAKAIRAAADAGARVLALDVAFAVGVDEGRPATGGAGKTGDGSCDPERDHDCVIAEAYSYAQGRMPVVCAVVPALLGNPQARKVPLNMLALSDGLAAYANLSVDGDDFIRRQKLISRSSADCTEDLRSLSLRTAEVFLKKDAVCEGPLLKLDGRTVPVLTQNGRSLSPDTLLINYAGPPGTFARVSLSNFLEAADRGDTATLRKWVNGKAVLLGPDTEYDRHATPYYTTLGTSPENPGGAVEKNADNAPVRWNTAGVEIHASTLNTLLAGNYLVPSPMPVVIIATLVAAAGTVVLAEALPPLALGIALPLWTLALLAGTNLAFRCGYVMPTVTLLGSALIAMLLTTLERYFWADRRRNLFRNAVDLFVGRRVGRSLEETGHIAMTGSQQVLTVMFSDIRGFTSFCESKSPAEVVAELNAYLAQMVNIIVAHHGSVNKFIGDGILVVFSDEDGTTPGDHATRAVRCGLEMTTAPNRFTTGIGIHSGPVVIGNVGSAEKLEYTVLGETVNIASRLENLNKQMLTRILFSDETMRRIRDGSDVYPLGAMPVRGLSAPVPLYTLKQVYPAAVVASNI